MKSSKGYLVAAFSIACSVLLIIGLWAVFGVLLPSEGGHAHGPGEMVMAGDFEARTTKFIEDNKLADGSVQASHDEPIYIMARQYTFTPNIIRLKTGEEYQVSMLSSDVVHAISINLGDISYNSVIMPMTITSFTMEPLEPGSYPVICNEYCGLGHDFMYFTFIVEEGGGDHEDEHADEDEPADEDEHAEDEHAEDEHSDGDEP